MLTVHNPATGENPVELSIVMARLNEDETLAACIREAQAALLAGKISGEIGIPDSGGTDGPTAIALRLGARLIAAPAKGYGNALMAGIAASRGKYVLMGDADDSYDFSEAPR